MSVGLSPETRTTTPSTTATTTTVTPPSTISPREYNDHLELFVRYEVNRLRSGLYYSAAERRVRAAYSQLALPTGCRVADVTVVSDQCHVVDACALRRTEASFRRFRLIVTGLVGLVVWPGGVMVRALACDSKGREFNSRPNRFHVTTSGKLFTHMRLCHQAV